MLNKLTIFYLFFALNVITSLIFLIIYALRSAIIKLSAITYNKLLKVLSIVYIFPVFLIIPFFYEKYFYADVIYSNSLTDFSCYVKLPANYLNDIIDQKVLAVLICLGLIWFIIASIKTLFFISCLRKTKQAIIKTNVADVNLSSLLKINVSNLKVKRSVDIFINAEIQRPCMVQLKKPTILIPNFKLSEKDLNYLIQHELLHIKTHDIFYIRLARVYKIFYWYNPLIILFMNSLIFSCEIANDERLTEDLDRSEKIYFIKLLQSCIKQINYPEKLEVISFSDNTKHIIRRIEYIMNFKKKRWSKYIAAFISGCILVSAPITAYAMTDNLYLSLSKLQTNQKFDVFEQESSSEEFVEFAIENNYINSNTEKTKYIEINPRGNNSIDEIIDAGGKIAIIGYSATSNTTVGITLGSTSKLPFSISACPSNGGNCKKINSNSKYMINASMSSFIEGAYTFYINNESSSKENHIQGSLLIIE